jgi:hypothetical protein
VGTTDDTVTAGRPLEVTVRCAAEHPLRITGGEVALVRNSAVAHFRRQWSGAGSTVSVRRSTVLAVTGLDVAGPVDAGQQIVLRARLDVPAGEATVAGHLVQQEYRVRARVRVEARRTLEALSAVRIVPAAEPGRLTVAAPVVDDADFAGLGLEELSGRSLAGGVPLSGVVTVTPRRSGAVRGLRVELVLDEHVPARAAEQVEEDRDAQTVLAVAPIAEDLDLQPGQVLRLPFTLRVPLPLPAPSIDTPEFTLRWLLRAVLDRPLRRDPVATVELCGTTA